MPTSAPTRTSTPALDLDTRLALTDAAMTLRLETAAVAHEVNTAHIPTEPISTTPASGNNSPAPTAPAGKPGPIARVLADTIGVLDARGWAATGRTCRTTNGGLCLAGAIRVAAGSSPNDADSLLAARAASFLLDVIRQTQQATTLPSWNDSQRNGDRPLRLLRQAAALASTLGI